MFRLHIDPNAEIEVFMAGQKSDWCNDEMQLNFVALKRETLNDIDGINGVLVPMLKKLAASCPKLHSVRILGRYFLSSDYTYTDSFTQGNRGGFVPRSAVQTLNFGLGIDELEKELQNESVESTAPDIEDAANHQHDPIHPETFAACADVEPAAAAVARCEIATQLDTDNMELKLKLARAYLANSQSEKAVETLQTTAARGHIPAAIMLGEIFRQGDGVEINFTTSMEWYIFAAEAGDSAAQIQVGRNYAEGKGVVLNEVSSLEWYQLAADQGNIVAQQFLESRRIAEVRRAREQEQEASEEQIILAKATEYRAKCAEGEYQSRRNSCQIILRSSKYSDIEGFRDFARENLRVTQITQCDLAVEIGYHEHLVSDPVDHPASLAEQACLAIKQSVRFSPEEKVMAAYNLNILNNPSRVRTPTREEQRLASFDACARATSHKSISLIEMNASTAITKCREAIALDQENPKLWGFLARALFSVGQYSEAAEWSQKTADQGSPYDHYLLATLYENGLGVEQSDTEALTRYQRAAELGSAEAQYTLAGFYRKGNGVAQSDLESARWYQLSANQGYGNAQYVLGSMYADGIGVDQDFNTALDWLQKATNQGASMAEEAVRNVSNRRTEARLAALAAEEERLRAIDNAKAEVEHARQAAAETVADLGKPLHPKTFNACAKVASPKYVTLESIDFSEAIRRCGLAVRRDPENVDILSYLARMTLRLRALTNLGDAEGQYNLGRIYRVGLGVPESSIEAAKLYRLSSDQGNADAQYNLAIMYEHGLGVQKNVDEAVRLYMLSSDQGNADAQYNLGKMYEKGRGVQRDFSEATKWLQLAANNGHYSARNISDTIFSMERPAQSTCAEPNWKNYVYSDISAPRIILACQFLIDYSQSENIREYARNALQKLRNDFHEFNQLAASQGGAEAQFNLGMDYAYGNSVEQNFTTALEWLQKAADQGFSGAEDKITEVRKTSLLTALDAKLHKLGDELARLENGGKPTERDIRTALQRKLDSAMKEVDAMGNMCASVGETEDPIAAVMCLFTLGGNLNSTTMGMHVQSTTLDRCHAMVSGIFICRYKATLRESSGSHPFVSMFTSLSEIDGYRYAGFRTDSDGWYVEQVYDNCTFNEDGDSHCTWKK